VQPSSVRPSVLAQQEVLYHGRMSVDRGCGQGRVPKRLGRAGVNLHAILQQCAHHRQVALVACVEEAKPGLPEGVHLWVDSCWIVNFTQGEGTQAWLGPVRAPLFRQTLPRALGGI